MINNELFDFLFSKDILAEYLTVQAGSSEWMNQLDLSITPVKYKKGHFLLNVGEIVDRIFFLVKGSVKGYYYDKEGKMRILYLSNPLSIITDITAYMSKSPSKLYLEVVEDTFLLALNRQNLNQTIHSFPESAIFLSSILLYYTFHHAAMNEALIELSPADRYLKVLETHPNIEQKFSQQDIASYLGISRQTLATIKKTIRRK